MRRATIALAALLAVMLLAGGAPAARDAATAPSWTTFGNGPAREGAADTPFAPADLKPAFFLAVSGRVTAQVLAAPARDGAPSMLVATTSDGRVYAVTTTGYVLWTRDFGQLATDCPQLDGYGITGTGAIDAAAHVFYVADAFGRLHALDLASGAERPGWPVRLFTDAAREHVWGGLLVADGRVYVPTGSYCDAGPMQGHVFGVDIATRTVHSWAAVPAELGGGGGIWGWGGVAYSTTRDSLFVATGNAFRAGHETAGYGEHLVELSPQLDVRAAGTTPEPTSGSDADLVGSPVVFDRAGCGELVAVMKKDGTLFAWRADDVAGGPLWSVEVERFDESNPVLAQPAYDAKLGALFVVTGRRIARIDVGADCAPRTVWSHALGTTTENGLPTVAGDTVWVTLSGKSWTLAAFDAATGAVRARVPIGGPVLTAPTIVGGSLFLGSFVGGLQAFGKAASAEAGAASDVAGHTSALTSRLSWVSRGDGVYASDDGGHSWRRIFGEPAERVVRTSRSAGLIVVGSPPPRCTCHPRILWTTNGGRTWHGTAAVAATTAGGGARLFWVAAAGKQLLQVLRWPPRRSAIRSRLAARAANGRFVDLARVPGGVVALLTARVEGHGWDNAPRVLLYRNGRSTTLRLPQASGSVLVRSVASAWPAIMVRGANFDAAGQILPLVWRSRNGGRTWTLARLGTVPR